MPAQIVTQPTHREGDCSVLQITWWIYCLRSATPSITNAHGQCCAMPNTVQAGYCKMTGKAIVRHEDLGKLQGHRCGSHGLHSCRFGMRIPIFGIQSSQLALHDELINLQPMYKHDNST